MCENEAGFRHADTFDGLETGGCEGEGAVSGEADIFGGKNYLPDEIAGEVIFKSTL